MTLNFNILRIFVYDKKTIIGGVGEFYNYFAKRLKSVGVLTTL